MSKSCCESKSDELVKLRQKQGSVLKIVMTINLVMFFGEFGVGMWANSTALMADSLDMLGDAIVYGFSLYVLHKSEYTRSTAALLKGIIIVFFGLGVLYEAVAKISSTMIPEAQTMGAIGLIALIANVTCLILLTRHKDDDLNMKSTWICSRNDIISNVSVMVAAGLVFITQSKWPDIIVGLMIAIIFLKSAWPILTESLAAMKLHKKKTKEDLEGFEL
ncbi:MAG: cation diffusion facilitator family transporter [Pseudobdellovibrionaceae bacterium]